MPLASMLKRSEKITTPTPSLKSDSPAITSSSSLGAPADFKIPNTAIGSVGEINAPSSCLRSSSSLRRFATPLGGRGRSPYPS
jgi:hypothetical protein